MVCCILFKRNKIFIPLFLLFILIVSIKWNSNIDYNINSVYQAIDNIGIIRKNKIGNSSIIKTKSSKSEEAPKIKKVYENVSENNARKFNQK